MCHWSNAQMSKSGGAQVSNDSMNKGVEAAAQGSKATTGIQGAYKA